MENSARNENNWYIRRRSIIMQYKGYEIEITEYGCIITDVYSNYIRSVETEQAAYEYLDDIKENRKNNKRNVPRNLYKDFESYCKRLPCKCYPDDSGKFATTNKKALDSICNSFKKRANVNIKVVTKFISSEVFYIVEEVTYTD